MWCVVRCSSARNHGRQDVGLPSRLASFSEGGTTKRRRQPSWWHTRAVNGTSQQQTLFTHRKHMCSAVQLLLIDENDNDLTTVAIIACMYSWSSTAWFARQMCFPAGILMTAAATCLVSSRQQVPGAVCKLSWFVLFQTAEG